MNKTDPFGDMTPAPGLVSGDDRASEEREAAAEEPVQADSIGAFLCATRMRASGDLQEIAKILCIRYGYLVAIEDGRHEDLPGSAYLVGFVRAYADYLGLDGNEVVRRLREETDGAAKTARFEFPMPNGESGLPNGGLLAIAMAMGLLVYGSWYTITNTDRDAVDLIQEVPGRLAVLIQDEDAGSDDEAKEEFLPDDVSQKPVLTASEDDSVEPEPTLEVAAMVPEIEPVEPLMLSVERQVEPEVFQTVATSEEEVAVSEVAAVKVEQPINTEGPVAQVVAESAGNALENKQIEVASVIVSVSKPEGPANSDAGNIEDTAATKLSSNVAIEDELIEEMVAADEEEVVEVPSVAEAASDEPLVIELRAKSDSWIQVRDGNELLLTRLLREGEAYQILDRQGLTLMTGNAGGLEVFVDGELMPPLGDVGVVRRGVPLSAERLRSGVAPS
ncbi:MAG: DUF4115 domain-containing protein [Rhodospirillaceae bacterium]|nr:DUF4115 domain-containing protein [Rhodospirillaceae bacterium]